MPFRIKQEIKKLFTCKITLRMSAFTDEANKSFVSRKHHNTMPPFVNIVNKSNIFLLSLRAAK